MIGAVDRMWESAPSADGETNLLNCFALVSYIPGRLGAFLDEIRRDLEPNSLAPRAHITLLPPRALMEPGNTRAAASYLQSMLAESPAVEIYLGRIEIFPVTNVVYLSVDGGFLQLREMHERLNSGPLGYNEPFHYHPHVTLAQGLTLEKAEQIRDEAARRWETYSGLQRFTADSFMFVQANKQNRWIDLSELALAPVPR